MLDRNELGITEDIVKAFKKYHNANYYDGDNTFDGLTHKLNQC